MIRESPLCLDCCKMYTNNEFNDDAMVLVDRNYTIECLKCNYKHLCNSNDFVLIKIQIVAPLYIESHFVQPDYVIYFFKDKNTKYIIYFVNHIFHL